jgi:hypothetical protein
MKSRNTRRRRTKGKPDLRLLHVFLDFMIPLVPKLHLGMPLSAQFHCLRQLPAGRGADGVGSAIAFPNGVWERGEEIHEEREQKETRIIGSFMYFLIS